MNASSTTTFMKTTVIFVRSPGVTFIRHHIINGWPHFEYLGRQQHSDFLYRSRFQHREEICKHQLYKRNLHWIVIITHGYLHWSGLPSFYQNFQRLYLSSFQDSRHYQFKRIRNNAELELQSQHETFFDFRIQTRSDFNDWENELRRRPWGLVSFIVAKCELQDHRGHQNFTKKWTFTKVHRVGTKWRIRHSAQQEWIFWTVYIWM